MSQGLLIGSRQGTICTPGPLDRLVMGSQLGSDLLADVAGGLIAEQDQRDDPMGRQVVATPGQKGGRDGTDGAPLYEPKQHLRRLMSAVPHQQPITGQSLRVRIGLGAL